MIQNELYHFGVPGMRWGVRKKYQTSETYNKVKNAKQAKKQAYKQYNKDFNKAYYFSEAHPFSQYIKKSKNYAESNKRWEKARNSADKYMEAKSAYKTAKNERKTKIKNTYKDLNKNAKLGEKLVYSKATRQKAAKYIVDNNMTVAEATKKAKGDAWRNAAIYLSVYAGIAVASISKNDKTI